MIFILSQNQNSHSYVLLRDQMQWPRHDLAFWLSIHYMLNITLYNKAGIGTKSINAGGKFSFRIINALTKENGRIRLKAPARANLGLWTNETVNGTLVKNS
uniref:Uncharacterized protein n=1 Tax=Romanomermis culicivorax TaxID=13658 RepID=A0A915HGF8_ROMCU